MVKRFSFLVGCAVVITVLLCAGACKKKPTTWDSDWNVPIINDSLNLDNLVRDSILSIEAGYYNLSIDQSVYELSLDNFVAIPDTIVNQFYALEIPSLSVPPGFSIINELKAHKFDLKDVQLKRASVANGSIELRVENPFPTKTFFTIELPGVTQNGQVLKQSFQANAGSKANPGVVTALVDLAGYDMDLRGKDLNLFNLLQSNLLVTSDPNGPAVTVTSSDSIRFSFKMKDIKLNYARGYFGSTIVSDTIITDIKGLNAVQSGSIDLPGINLDLSLINGLKVNAKLKLTHVRNTNVAGQTVNLQHADINRWLTVNSATGTSQSLVPSTTLLSFTPSNSNLEQFVENLGVKNEIGFILQLNPWGNTSGSYDEIFPTSKLELKVKGTMPISIGANALIIQDTFDFKLAQNEEKTNVNSGVIWLKVANAFPIQGELTAVLLDENNQTIGTLTSNGLVASSVTGQLEKGIRVNHSRVEVPVSEEIIDKLPQIAKMIVRVRLDTPNETTSTSQQVKIPAGAFIGVQVGAKLSIRARL